jgi:hypothetical protein
MSQAFIRESDEQWLDEIRPTLSALIVFLTRENNGIDVYEKRNYIDESSREVHVMSNGSSYTKNVQGQWQMI